MNESKNNNCFVWAGTIQVINLIDPSHYLQIIILGVYT